MSLGNLLLQPQRLERNTGDDPNTEIMQGLMRLMTLLAEDAADSGPLTGAMPELVNRLATRIQAQAKHGIGSVFTALKTRFHPLFLYFERLVDKVTQLDKDPAALIGIVREIIADLLSLLNNTNQAQIKSQLDFGMKLLEQNLGIDSQFIEKQINTLLDDLIELWQQLPDAIEPKQRRRQRLAVRLVKRLRSHLQNKFSLPRINTAQAASKLYQLLQSTGIQSIVEEIHCALDKFDQALEAVNEIRAALPLTVGGGSVGAALIEPEGSSRYCWYASWLLSDVDLPLLGTCDIADEKRFAINLRFRTSVIKKQAAVSKYIFSTLPLTQQQELMAYPGGKTKPDKSLILMVVAHLNALIQQGPIYTPSRFNTPHQDQSEQDLTTVPFEFRLRDDESFSLSEDLQKLANNYADNQELYLFNRRFLEWVYGEDLIDSLWNSFWRYLKRKTIGISRDVYISGDGRYLMCDDIPIYSVAEGSELKWENAPLFFDKNSGRSRVPGATYYDFKRVSAGTCDTLAQVFYTLEQSGRPIWHLADLQPGHEIGTGIVSGLDIAHTLNMICFGKPINGYESLHQSGLLGKCGIAGTWGKLLASDFYGPRTLGIVAGSFQGLNTEATENKSWAEVVFEDFMRIYDHNSKLKMGRDGLLAFITLLNSSRSNSGESSLPSNPAANHLKQAGITSPMNKLFAYLLMRVYKSEGHSIGLWFGGGVGFGLMSGFSGGCVSQFIAWQEDFELMGITILESMASVVIDYSIEHLGSE